MRIVKFVVPFVVLCVIYAIISTLVIFMSDWNPLSKGQISSGLALQCQIILMASREVFVTCYDWFRGKMFHYKMRYIRYACFCCLDGCLVLAFTIWATVMLATGEDDVQSGFIDMTWTNVIFGYIHYCLTCCAPGPCLQVYHGGNAERYVQSALFEDFGRPVEDNLEEQR